MEGKTEGVARDAWAAGSSQAAGAVASGRPAKPVAPADSARPANPARPTDPCIRAENEDDDGYDPYSDRRPAAEPLFERDPWA
ncbi:hypothetical protein [uncultured Parolsenella sp.]|uniref:hypothetical protein n=1 Tax=uncultured Parolsenella sp. TaxID=2083008 RepID=UPI0027DBB812|nr:hypothetical protein [uncultured Parolsenella sp.]